MILAFQNAGLTESPAKRRGRSGFTAQLLRRVLVFENPLEDNRARLLEVLRTPTHAKCVGHRFYQPVLISERSETTSNTARSQRMSLNLNALTLEGLLDVMGGGARLLANTATSYKKSNRTRLHDRPSRSRLFYSEGSLTVQLPGSSSFNTGDLL